jgi:hypothetical protein
VGLAWERAVAAPGLPTLWAPDGSHPSLAGSYLAACVIYQVIYARSPVGNGFVGGLDAPVAAPLQRIASETVSAYAQP